MNCKNLIFFILVCGSAYSLSIFGSGCAQIGAPTGGPRDSIAPKLLSINPLNQALNFKGSRITLTYEYVQLQNCRKIYCLTPKIIPNVDYKLKTVTLKYAILIPPIALIWKTQYII
jgi:hypothetical protein